jgi:oligopeptidase B
MLLVLGAGLATSMPDATPPLAERRPHEVASAHGTRVDPYYWLRDDTRSRPDVPGTSGRGAYYEA